MGPQSKSEWLKSILTGGPAESEWPELMKALPGKFPGLDSEAQAAVAERLASFGSDPAATEAMDAIYAGVGVSLPAMLILAKAKKGWGEEVAPQEIRAMEQWSALCEDDEGEGDPLEFFNLPVKAQDAVIEHLIEWLRADLLSALAARTADKERTKVLKKAIHRAKSAGASLDQSVGVVAGGAPVFAGPERDEFVDEAYLSPPDHDGTYFVYFYRTVFGKNHLYVVLINDLKGVLRFEGHEVAVPKFRKIIESTRQNPFAVLVKVDSGFARSMVKEAEAAGQAKGLTQDRDYLGSRRALGVADQEAIPHPLWESFKEDELKQESGLVARSHELLVHRLFEDWRLQVPEEGRLLVELDTVRRSPIELTPPQKAEREREVFEQETARVLSDLGREVWRVRMINCALVLSLMEQDDNARMAAAVAVALADPKVPPPSFFVELLRRTVAHDTAPDGEGPAGPDLDRGGVVVG